MIEFDVTGGLPVGTQGWSRLFQAVEGALPTDETEWVEFKAGVDPGTPGGRAHIAKATLAFANRDPARAKRWLGGYALVIVGLEPGNLQGCPVLDPAQIHDSLNRLFKEPAPDYDFAYHRYKQHQVLVVTVSPPRQGDPIALPAKSSDALVDGRVYVRRPGKSDNATSTDIRRLEARAQPATALPQLTVSASTPGAAIAKHVWPPDWQRVWLEAERERLLSPLAEQTNRSTAGASSVTLSAAERQAVADARKVLSAFAGRLVPEERTPDEFRAQVDAYLASCADALDGCEGEVAAGFAPVTAFLVRNDTNDNLKEVEVIVHIEGDVVAHEPTDSSKLRSWCPDPPRPWGPRREPPISLRPASGFPGLRALPGLDTHFGTSVDIRNDGSTTLTFPPVHLRPGEEVTLDGIVTVIVLPDFTGDSLRCTWQATATNLSGVMKGNFVIALDADPVDLTAKFEFELP